ncbi:MAG: hypothetical protein DRJ97_02035 [Thermoprotei archaeon]|nr:MAG: hypothetical protein DRJ97_02035 [Thermoprotei archaeon]
MMSVEEKVLEALRLSPKGAGLTQLVKQTGLKRSEVLRALEALVNKGLVEKVVKGCRATYVAKQG